MRTDSTTRWQLHFFCYTGLCFGAVHGIWVGYHARDIGLALIIAFVGGGTTGFAAVMGFMAWLLSRVGFMLLWHYTKLGEVLPSTATSLAARVFSAVSALGFVLLVVWLSTALNGAIASNRGGEKAARQQLRLGTG